MRVVAVWLRKGRYESTQFNSRLQPTQIALGTSANNASLLKLEYDYGNSDNNGNVKSQTITIPNMTHPLIQTYSYDSYGRRVKKISGNETTVFVYNGLGQMVAEYAINVPVPQNPTTSYLTTDNLGTPRINTDSIGNVQARHDYLPFGEEINRLGGRNANNGYQSDSIRQKYTGYQRDTESGLDFAQARYYASLAGRFTSVDPLMASAKTTNPQTFNRYSYVLNNPYKLVDPSGLESEEVDQAFAHLGELADEAEAIRQAEEDAAREAAQRQQQQQNQQSGQQQTTPQNNQQGQAPQQNIKAPQKLIAEGFALLTTVNVLDENGNTIVVDGILLLDDEITNELTAFLNYAYDQGYSAGTAAAATNGIVIPQTATKTTSGSVQITTSGKAAEKPEVSVGENVTIGKSVAAQFNVAISQAVQKDIDNRQNVANALGAAVARLGDRQVKVETPNGRITSTATSDFFTTVFKQAAVKLYVYGVNAGYNNTIPPGITTVKKK